MKIKVLELFAGIGALSKALERLDIEHEIVDAVEIDKYAVKSFNAIHNTNFEPQDICEWEKDIEVDLIMHGSPCQDFSLAGKQAGGDKDSGTRSSLMYETIRIVEKLKPKYVIWENVKNLLSKKHKHNFDAYLEKMNELGYVNYYQVLNAKDYGIPQNRERVFTVSIRKDIDKGYTFPEPQELKLKLKDMLEDEVDEKYYLSGKKNHNKNMKQILCDNLINSGILSNNTIINHSYTNGLCGKNKNSRQALEGVAVDNNVKVLGNYSPSGYEASRIVDCNGIAPIVKENYGTVTATYVNLRIRKLTPKECWRLMGFDDADFEKASKVNSNAQLYKQAGNSIVVNVLEAILTNLLK